MKETLKATKQYRIKLFTGADSVAEKLILLAAQSNGGNWVSIKQMQNLVEAKKLEHPTLYKDYTGEVINGKLLHLDVPCGGGEYKTVLSIEEIDLLESELKIDDDELDNDDLKWLFKQ